MYSRCFSLIELIVVMGIIVLIMAMTLPPLIAMWDERELASSKTIMTGMLNAARQASRFSTQGVIVFNGPAGYQNLAYLKPLNVPDLAGGETWPDCRYRYEIELPGVSHLIKKARITSLDTLSWTEDQIANDDYRNPDPPFGDPNYTPGQFHRNFFVIMFRRRRLDLYDASIILHDLDADGDGFGDITNLAVGGIDGDYGGRLENIVIDNNGNRLEWAPQRGVLIYSADDFKEFPVKSDFLFGNHIGFALNRFGEIIDTQKEP